VYSPQIIENYQLQSGEGLSLLFIYTWLLGDLCNLVGAVKARLLPTMIILGAYVGLLVLVPILMHNDLPNRFPTVYTLRLHVAVSDILL
jgi:hypothetical protein